jgi:sugar phosphate permease
MSGMFSGYLQAGAYKGLDRKLDHAGWQWLYIVCGVISLPIGIAGYFFIPDFPETTRAFCITPKEAQFARDRLAKEGMKPLGASQWDRKKICRLMTQWQFWVLPIGYFIVQGALPAYQPVFALWLKSTHRSVYQINVLPTAESAVGVVVQILAGQLSDSPLLKGRRWQAILFMQAGTFFSVVVLAVWNVSDNLKFVAYYMMYFASGVPGVYYAWYPDLIPHDHEMRGFIIACSNMFSFTMSILVTVAVWRTVDSPRFHAGFIYACVSGVAVGLLVVALRFLEIHDTKKRALKQRGALDVETTPAVPGSGSENDAAGSEKDSGVRTSASGREETPADRKLEVQ